MAAKQKATAIPDKILIVSPFLVCSFDRVYVVTGIVGAHIYSPVTADCRRRIDIGDPTAQTSREIHLKLHRAIWIQSNEVG